MIRGGGEESGYLCNFFCAFCTKHGKNTNRLGQLSWHLLVFQTFQPMKVAIVCLFVNSYQLVQKEAVEGRPLRFVPSFLDS